MEGDAFRSEESNKGADNVTNFEVALPVVKKYETITRSQNKNILNVAYRKDITLKKFRESKKFFKMVNGIKIRNPTL